MPRLDKDPTNPISPDAGKPELGAPSGRDEWSWSPMLTACFFFSTDEASRRRPRTETRWRAESAAAARGSSRAPPSPAGEYSGWGTIPGCFVEQGCVRSQREMQVSLTQPTASSLVSLCPFQALCGSATRSTPGVNRPHRGFASLAASRRPPLRRRRRRRCPSAASAARTETPVTP